MNIDDQLQNEAERMVRLAGRKHFKEKLRRLEDSNHKQGENFKVYSIFRRLAVAAAVVFLLVIPLWWHLNSRMPTSDQLFAEFFDTYRSPDIVRGETTDAEGLWARAVAAYADGNFHSATLLFDELSNKDDNYLTEFYLGQSLLNLEASKADSAVAAFTKVLRSEHDYRQQAQWYLALAYIKASETYQASLILEEIAENEGHYKQNEARKLLRQL